MTLWLVLIEIMCVSRTCRQKEKGGRDGEVINLHAKLKPQPTFIPFSPVPSSDPLPLSASSNLFSLLLGHPVSTQALAPALAISGLIPVITQGGLAPCYVHS